MGVQINWRRDPIAAIFAVAALLTAGAAQVRADASGPAINVWYGSPQTFGTPGLTQHWVNVLGNVSDPDGVAEVTFTLNGGAPQTLALGPDQRRLLAAGDFNVEIDILELNAGANDVAITARDNAANVSTTHVQVDYAAGNVWPLPWSIEWAGVSALQSVAQVVDGQWAITPGGLRPTAMGYDRLVAIGDLAWRDYEITLTLTLNALDPAGFNWPSVSPGFGMTTRWSGHTDNPVSCPQPHCGWLPSGGGFWYDAGNNGPLALFGDETLYETRNQTLTLGTPYTFRVRAQNQTDGSILYAVKVWPEGGAEPADWQLSGLEPPSPVAGGSILLVAHHVDITIKNCQVTPVAGPETIPPQISGVQVIRQFDAATILWTTDEPATGAVRYGATSDYSAGTVASASSGTNHVVQLTGLAANTTYHYQITATDVDNNTAQTADATFTTLAAADTAPPVISNVQVSAGSAGAVITWTTDEAATSAVDYGTSDAFGQSAGDAALATAHQVTLVGLAADTLYHYRVTSVDAAGNSASSSALTFTTEPAPEGALVSDEFNGAALDPAVWTFVNPLSDANVAMTGTQVSVNLPVTPSDHEIWFDANTAPRILQAVADVDFGFEVKFDSPLTQEIQIQGVTVEEDALNAVRVEYHYLAGAVRLFVASVFDGGFVLHRHQAVSLAPPMYLRVERAGDDFTVSYSADGTNYTVAAAFNQPMTATAVGIHMGASGGVAHGALVDWFHDLSAPQPPPPGDDCNANGVPDADELAAGAAQDCNGNGVPDACDLSGDDCDADGVPDECEPNADGDALIDACDGCPADPAKTAPGACGCGEPDADADGDGVLDCIDNCPTDANTDQADCDADGVGDACAGGADCNVNGTPDSCEPDGDNDGAIDACDGCPADAAKTAPGACGCGTADTDGDADGVPDCSDNCPTVANADQADCDADGVGDACANEPDCNANGKPDACDIAGGVSDDANDNAVPDECEEPQENDAPIMETGTVVVGGWRQRVQFTQRFENPVVVCTVNYRNNTRPVVARVSNVTGHGFDVRLQNPSNHWVSEDTVSYLVMEEGAWVIDGVRCEAQRYISFITDSDSRWNGERRRYLQSYNQPVVLGQVMTEFDPRWSAFWCCGSRRQDPPSRTALTTGKMVGEDYWSWRLPEIVGFIVFETASGELDGTPFESRVGADSVAGVGNNPPYAYNFTTPFAQTPSVLLATQAGMDDTDGSWAITYRTPATKQRINLAVDEDQVKNSERRHSTEQVGYIVFGQSGVIR